VHTLCIEGPAFDLLTTMSKFLCIGMPLTEVIRAAQRVHVRRDAVGREAVLQHRAPDREGEGAHAVADVEHDAAGAPVTADGRVRPEVREARARGVVFDIGHGMGSFAFSVSGMPMQRNFDIVVRRSKAGPSMHSVCTSDEMQSAPTSARSGRVRPATPRSCPSTTAASTTSIRRVRTVEST
jgi:hypothetical protein